MIMKTKLAPFALLIPAVVLGQTPNLPPSPQIGLEGNPQQMSMERDSQLNPSNPAKAATAALVFKRLNSSSELKSSETHKTVDKDGKKYYCTTIYNSSATTQNCYLE